MKKEKNNIINNFEDNQLKNKKGENEPKEAKKVKLIIKGKKTKLENPSKILIHKEKIHKLITWAKVTFSVQKPLDLELDYKILAFEIKKIAHLLLN